jgi:hypothetical protein
MNVQPLGIPYTPISGPASEINVSQAFVSMYSSTVRQIAAPCEWQINTYPSGDSRFRPSRYSAMIGTCAKSDSVDVALFSRSRLWITVPGCAADM